MIKSRSRQFRFLARLHFWVLACSLFGYVALVFTLGPNFFSFDVAQKIRALADEVIVVTAVVLGPPQTPVVTATPSCVSGNPRIVLDWADDAATTAWDIERDSSTLTTGVASSGYTDTAVVGNTSYTYTVTAFGPMSPGVAVSSSVSATALDCASLLPAATLTLTRLGGKDITPPRTLPIKIDDNRPRIRGNTNVLNAVVTITLTRPSITAEISANANGYFSWKPPRALQAGRHMLTVTSTDPNDNSRTTSETLEFYTKKIEADREDDISSPLLQQSEVPPFDFSLTILSSEARVKQGDRLEFAVKPARGIFPSDTVFEPKIVDERGEVIFTAPSQSITPQGRPGLSWSMEIPVYIPEGKYMLQVEAFFNNLSITRSAPVIIDVKPLFRLGDHGVVTYAEGASYIGWILFGILGVFASFFLFLLREYWLYLHSAKHITERELKRFGVIVWRKGVGKL